MSEAARLVQHAGDRQQDHREGNAAAKSAYQNAQLLNCLPHPDLAPACRSIARWLMRLNFDYEKAHLAKRNGCTSAHRVRVMVGKSLLLFGKKFSRLFFHNIPT